MTANRAALHLRVWNDGKPDVVALPVPASEAGSSATVELRCLPGASAIHVVVSDDTRVHARAEIAADPGEVVPVKIDLDERGAPYVWSRGRTIFHLAQEARFDPPMPIQPSIADAPMDLAIVVDGTLRGWPEADKKAASSSEQSFPLLESTPLWTVHVDRILAFVDEIVRGRDARVAVLAFGDQDPPAVTARDLRPQYRLFPREDQRALQPFDRNRVREKMLAIPPTSGGDFVDAVADALAASAHLLSRDNVRKLVLLTGDSPGGSVLHPLPKGGDLCVRTLDVDVQAQTLHNQGVEIMTIYHAPRADLGLYAIAFQRDLIRAAQDQYRRLASLPELAFEASTFQPDQAAERFRNISGPIARGAALGELVR